MNLVNQLQFLCCGSIGKFMPFSISQLLDCKSVETRTFDCTSTVESVWVKIVDKKIIQETLAPCASLFTNKYINVA